MIGRIRAFIEGERADDFGGLALDLFAWQMERNPDYAAFCAGARPTRWQDIPAVPVALFRDLPLSSFPPGEAGVLFRTSGTTGKRGVVRLKDTVLYDLGARRHAEAVLGPLPRVGVSLAPVAADSSLGHMCRDLVPGMPEMFSLARGVDVPGAWAALRAAREPVFVPGTAFAFADLVGGATGPVRLPEGSIVMVTGGFKGRTVAYSAALLTERLRVLLPGARLVGEYGMSELSSQLWSARLGAPFTPPPWLGVLATDPRTAAPVEGTGLLRFVDLASVWTVPAIETRDLGEVLPDGRVQLHGRLEGDQARGCSLTVEEVRRRRAHEDDAAPETPALSAPPRASRADLPVVVAPTTAPPAPTAGDARRVVAVLRALDRLRGVDLGAVAMGLHPDNARAALDTALSGLTAGGLARELATPGRRPRTVSVVVPWGVFTTPIEWTALYAAAGAAVHLKAPTRDPAFCVALAAAFGAEGLPVTVGTARELGAPDAVVAFGGDASVAAVAAATPGARHALFGHRFSVALVADDPRWAEPLVRDHLLYDTRGCMAPAAVFVLGTGDALFDALPDALRAVGAALPAGDPAPELGPEVRRRLGLARARGRARELEGAAAALLPASHFHPVALPRMVTVHPVADAAAFTRALAPWQDHLSALSTDDPRRPWQPGGGWLQSHAWFTRIDAPGHLQRPPFPRRHDGVPMLGAVLGP